MINRTKTASVIGSELRDKIEIGQTTSQIAQWYHAAYQHRSQYRKAPASLPSYKEAHPYHLIIHRIQGLTATKKNPNSNLFIHLNGMLATDKFEILGLPFNYQYQESLGRNDTKWEVPFHGYFHSKIDKNYQQLYLFIKVQILEIRDSVVDGVVNVGTLIIRSPFLEEENKTVPIIKDVNEVEFAFMPVEARKKLITSNSTVSALYSVESVLELKRLSKIVPENSVFTHQDSISGLKNCSIPRDNSELVLKEASSVQLTILFLQIHISQRYEQQLVSLIKRLYPSDKNLEIRSRKVALGYHNEYILTSPLFRKLQFLDKEVAGQMRVNIYEALSEGQIVKVPFYVDKQVCCGVVTVGLVYQIGQKEVETACYYLMPAEKGEDISESMVTGAGLGAVYQMLEVPSADKPTIIMEYQCDFRQTQTVFKDDELQLTSRDLSSRQLFDEQAVARQKERLRQQIERERMQILRQKEQMQKIKGQSYIQFQSQFERKFQVQKQSLYKKQQMIENQYREQVQKEIREKFELEDEIKKMTEKLKSIEEQNFNQSKGSPLASPSEEYRMGSPRFDPKEEGSFQQVSKQRMDPGYIVEPENPVPVRKVREILQKSAKPKSQLIKVSEQQFNYASKFTFSFISIVWSNNLSPPKNLYFVLRFFNQQQFMTDNLSYLGSEGNYHQLVRTSLFSMGQENKEPTYSFTIDPSEYHQPHLLQKDLVAYLANNAAIVDVFCGESHLYIGQINIKLKELIRGTKNQTLIAKELTMVRLKDKEQLGVLQVLIKNEQVQCKAEVSLKERKRVKELKKKVVSNNPIFIPAQEKHRSNREQQHRGELIRPKGNTTRQQLRIQKYKEQKAMKAFKETANGFSNLQDNQKGTVLNQILNYKEKKMEDYIKNVYASLLNEQINLTAQFGRAVTFPFLFQNTSQSAAAYKVSIMGVGDENEGDLTLVKVSKEWRFFVAEHNYSEPKRYDMIGENNTFFLHPGESIPLIFKYLSFLKRSQNSSERVLNVTICKEDNNWIAGGFSLLVQMHESVIHHSYILYEPGDQIVDIVVPVIYSETENTTKPKRLYLTDSNPTSSAQWLNPYEILVRIETPKIMEKLQFNLLLYNDEYFCDLTQNWLIELHAYQGVCAYFRSDFNTKFKITMPWSAVPAHLGLLSLDRASSSLKLYASSSALIFKESFIEVQSDRRDEGGCQIWCQLLGSENIRKSAEITCVSGQEGELIYGWTVTVYPYVSRT